MDEHLLIAFIFTHDYLFRNKLRTSFSFLSLAHRHCDRRKDCSPVPGVDPRQAGLRRRRERAQLRHHQGQDAGHRGMQELQGCHHLPQGWNSDGKIFKYDLCLRD